MVLKLETAKAQSSGIHGYTSSAARFATACLPPFTLPIKRAGFSRRDSSTRVIVKLFQSLLQRLFQSHNATNQPDRCIRFACFAQAVYV
jgi:hypothetical protein